MPPGKVNTAVTAFADGAAPGKTYAPLTPQSLLTAWWSMTVPCINQSGKQIGNSIPIIDSNQLMFVDGAATLAGASATTKAWAGKNPSVTVVYDPNACAGEDPFSGDDWASGGLLIRGAYLNKNNELTLLPWVTTHDINFIDVTPSGAFESDFSEPDDNGLVGYPQLLAPIQAAKAGLLSAAASN